MAKYTNPICAVWWLDAAYSFETKLPESIPHVSLAIGFVIKQTSEFINISSNILYNEEDNSITPVDGILIPNRMIIKFEKIRELHNNE